MFIEIINGNDFSQQFAQLWENLLPNTHIWFMYGLIHFFFKFDNVPDPVSFTYKEYKSKWC